MKITVLTDDKVKNRRLLAEHGLSLFIEYKDCNILFDTGQSDVYIQNANALQFDLNKTDFIVLSHGHYDHCGGIYCFPGLKNIPKIYLQKSAVKQKYAINSDGKTYREIGIPWCADDYDITFINGNKKISDDIALLGNIPSTVEFEEISKGLFIKNGNEISADMMTDEQVLVFDTEKGLIVFLGCSHPGIINCLHYTLKQFPGKKIDTVVAGMHLDNVNPLRLQLTIQQLTNLGIRKVYPLHCTGICAISEMKKILGEKCGILYAGDSVEI
ncbi:MBL fold metallo-hydrolase [Anaerotignum sp.]|uniref:MBL fold metallo-hydrolase n=1 Tax=Anaerotignum sp. TaxID=2039241 RepID=UPI00271532F0|nr:MBL fold metallo-hydrolase [Anaerotignum sp.]